MKKKQRKASFLMISALMSILVSSGLMTNAIVTEPRWGGTLVTSCHDDPSTLNPCLTTIDPTFIAAHNIFSTLIVFDMNFDPQPNLATSWTISSDGLTYTFQLVQNATFHDGHNVTSADVKFTMEEVVKKYSPWGITIFDCVDRVETPDPYTVVFKLKYPFAVFMTVMNLNYFCILPKHLYEGTDILTNPYNTSPVGSGPYKFEEWMRGDHITVKRYANYFKSDKPYVDRIVYRIVPNEATVDLMLEKGEIDYVSSGKLLPQDVDRLKSNPNLVIDEREYLALSVFTYVFLNCKEGHITADVRVRQAIAHAINKTLHLDKAQLMQGKTSATQFTPFLEWCYNSDPENAVEYNITKANEILDAAGYPRDGDGVRFHLKAIGAAWYVRHYKNTELLIPQLKEIGIELDYELMERAVYNEKVFGNYEYDVTCLAGTVTPDPTIGTERFFATDSINGLPWTNVAHYSNPEVDELFEFAANTSDKEKRREYFFEIQEILNVDVPAVGLYAPNYYSGWSRKIIGLPKGPWFGFEPDDSIWLEDQHKYSPRVCSEAIAQAEQLISELEDKGYEISSAESKLNEAKNALTSGDYTRSKESADLAPTLAITPGTQPSPIPYELFVIVIVVLVIAGISIGLYMWRRKP